MSKLYGHTTDAIIDSRENGKWFAKHMDAMTREGLHSKADIAAELAYRDTRITQFEALLRECDEYLSPNPLNSIGTGSILHQKMCELLEEVEG